MSYKQRKIAKSFEGAKLISMADHPKLVIMSDCHRGNGSWGDSFLPNRPLYTAALKYYYRNNFTYIELGDGDELWENRCFTSIYEIHREVYNMFLEFQKDNRLFMVFGNHDRIKENSAYIMSKLPIVDSRWAAHAASDPRLNPTYAQNRHNSSNSRDTLIPFYESIIIETASNDRNIYMFHGYQGDILNDDLWKLSRFLVRYLWRPLELSGFKDPTSAAKNYSKSRSAATRFQNYSQSTGCILIAGHTHKPSLPRPGDSLYFNSGSCVHPNTVTALEIQDNQISLVKWSTCSRDDMSLYVCRTTEGTYPLSAY